MLGKAKETLSGAYRWYLRLGVESWHPVVKHLFKNHPEAVERARRDLTR